MPEPANDTSEKVNAMNLTSMDLENGRQQLRIETDWDEISDDYKDIVSDYCKIAVPGFRPGKAPKSLVERHHSRNILDDLKARCIDRLYRKALKNQNLMAGSRVEISDIELEPHQPFRFTIVFTSLPVFELPDYSNLKLQGKTDGEQRDEFSEWLLTHTQITVPDDLVREELEFDSAADAEPGSERWNDADDRVKLIIILQRIAENDGIEVDDKDLDDRIALMASEYEMAPRDLRQRLLQNGGLFRIRNFLLAELTLDYLLDTASQDERNK